ncbi:hypothetical protein FKP32DRAFT_950316 [Trametes sanguinea]|nr:hypothetical protein FKP32DRAFT_950316 [Trametes sanguinea]
MIQLSGVVCLFRELRLPGISPSLDLCVQGTPRTGLDIISYACDRVLPLALVSGNIAEWHGVHPVWLICDTYASAGRTPTLRTIAQTVCRLNGAGHPWLLLSTVGCPISELAGCVLSACVYYYFMLQHHGSPDYLVGEQRSSCEPGRRDLLPEAAQASQSSDKGSFLGGFGHVV